MEIAKVFHIATEYRDPKMSLQWESRLFADVIFIDKTHTGCHSLLYQLKDYPSFKNSSDKNADSFSRQSFLLLGEVASVDKKKKQVLLLNKNIVSYTYLVIVNAVKRVISNGEQEFQVGLQALIDALRVKPKIPNSFAPTAKSKTSIIDRKTFPTAIDLSSDFRHDINKIAHPYISSSKNFTPHSTPSQSINKCLYEVQL